jgi:hypothetical protein
VTSAVVIVRQTHNNFPRHVSVQRSLFVRTLPKKHSSGRFPLVCMMCHIVAHECGGDHVGQTVIFTVDCPRDVQNPKLRDVPHTRRYPHLPWLCRKRFNDTTKGIREFFSFALPVVSVHNGSERLLGQARAKVLVIEEAQYGTREVLGRICK